MSNISLNYDVQPEAGRVLLALDSNDLPPGRFKFSISFTYNSNQLKYETISVPGSYSISSSSSSDGITGTATITGSLAPSSSPFLSLIFEGSGTGTLGVTINDLTINDSPANFAQPGQVDFDLSAPQPDPTPIPQPDPIPDPIPDPEPDPLPDPGGDYDTNPLDFLTAVYVAAFNRAPEHEGLKYWWGQLQSALREGMPEPDAYKWVAHHMYWSGAQHGEQGTTLPNAEYVHFLYRTVLGREGDSGGLNYWIKRLDNEEIPRSEFIATFLSSALKPGNSDGEFVRARVEVAKQFASEVVSGEDAIKRGLTESLGDVLEGVVDAETAKIAVTELWSKVLAYNSEVHTDTHAEWDANDTEAFLLSEPSPAPYDDEAPSEDLLSLVEQGVNISLIGATTESDASLL